MINNKNKCRIDIRLTDIEKQAVVSRARSVGLSVSAFIRHSAIYGVIEPQQELLAEKRRICAGVGRICGNIHALAKYANTNKSDANGLEILISLKKLEAEIIRLRESV